MSKSKFYYLTGAILLASLTALLILLVQQDRVKLEVGQVLMVLAGMTSLATLGAFQRFMESGKQKSYIGSVTFDEVYVGKAISSVLQNFNPEHVKTAKYALKDVPRWEIKSSELVGEDNSLALAKLRMDLERELRRIAEYIGIDLSERRMILSNITQELESKKVLPAEWSYALRDIIDVCNRAVHGFEVPTETAATVVRTGNELLRGLYVLRNEIEANPNRFNIEGEI
jgi:hypothetical protein